MPRPTWRASLLAGAALAAAALVATASAPAMAAAPRASAPHPPVAPQKANHALGQARLFVKTPSSDGVKQALQLAARHDTKDALALAKVLATPQAVWLDGGTPAEVRKTVQTTVAQATLQRAVPVFVAYNIPGRDCGSYSAGGAQTTADYDAWIDGIAAGIGNAKAAILVEPDGLGLLPNTNCGVTTPGADDARYAQLNYAVTTLEAKPNTSVYLDSTHPAWMTPGDITPRLIKAGVNQAQGFFTNVSNYQWTSNAVENGTWISDCIALVNAGGDPANCKNKYWNGTGALDDNKQWSPTSSDPTANTAWIDDQYQQALAAAGVQPTAHFVVDTSRNGTGPNSMATYAAAPYDQSAATIATLAAGSWCNPPGAGIGLAPTTNTGKPLVDAYLWAKTPGESDGQCDAVGGARAWDYSVYSQPGWPTDAAGQAAFDPLWGQDDPAAGDWFPAQVLDLIKHANPAL
jgi:endoglucanase